MDRNGNNVLYYRTLNYGMGYVQLPNGSVTANANAAAGSPQINGLNTAAATLSGNHSNGLLPGLPTAAAPTAATGPTGSYMSKWMVPHLTPSQINFLFKNRMDKKKAQTPVKCDTCGIVLNSEQQAKQHFDGKAHIKKLRKLGLPIPEEHMGKVMGKAGKRRYPCICKDSSHSNSETNPDKTATSPDRDQEGSLEKESSSLDKDDKENPDNNNPEREQNDSSKTEGTVSDPDGPPPKKKRFFHRRRWKPYKCEVCNCGNDWESKDKDANNENGKNQENSPDDKNTTETDLDKENEDKVKKESENNGSAMDCSSLGDEAGNDVNSNAINMKSCDKSYSNDKNSSVKLTEKSAIQISNTGGGANDKTAKLNNYLSSFSDMKDLKKSEAVAKECHSIKSCSSTSAIINSEKLKSPAIKTYNMSISGNQTNQANVVSPAHPLGMNKFPKNQTGYPNNNNNNTKFENFSSKLSVNSIISSSASNSKSVALTPQMQTSMISSDKIPLNSSSFSTTGNNMNITTLSSSSGLTNSVLSKPIISSLAVSKQYVPGKLYPQVPGIGVAAISHKVTTGAAGIISPSAAAGIPQASTANIYNGHGLITGNNVLSMATGSSNNTSNQRHVQLSYQTLPQSQNSIFSMTNGTINGALSPTTTPYSTALTVPSVTPPTLYYPSFAGSSLTEQSYTPVGGSSPTNSALNNLYSPYLPTQPVASAMVLSDQTYAVMPSIDLNANQAAYTYGCTGSGLNGSSLLQSAFTGTIQALSQNGLKGDSLGYQNASGKEQLAITSGYYDDLNSNNNNNCCDDNESDVEEEHFRFLNSNDSKGNCFDESDNDEIEHFSFLNSNNNNSGPCYEYESDEDTNKHDNFINNSFCSYHLTVEHTKTDSSGTRTIPTSLVSFHSHVNQLKVVDDDKWVVRRSVSSKKCVDIVTNTTTTVSVSDFDDDDDDVNNSGLNDVLQQPSDGGDDGGHGDSGGHFETQQQGRTLSYTEQPLYQQQEQQPQQQQGPADGPTTKKLDPVSQAIMDNIEGKLPTKRKMEIPCTICNAIFNSQSQAEAHFQGSKHLKRANEKGIDASVTTIQSIPAKRQAFQKAEHSCWLCEKFYHSKGELRTHLYTKEHIDFIQQSLVCLVCMKSFNSEVQSEQHYISEKHGKKLADYAADLLENDRPVFGDECEKPVAKQYYPENKVESKKANIQNKNTPTTSSHQNYPKEVYSCNACQKTFNSATQSSQHFESAKHKEMTQSGQHFPRSKPKEMATKDCTNICTVCQVSFNSPIQAAQHYESKNHANNLAMNNQQQQGGSSYMDYCQKKSESAIPGLVSAPKKMAKSSPLKKGAVLTIDYADTKFTQELGSDAYRCLCCGVLVNSMTQLAQHYTGSTHKKNAASWTGEAKPPATNNPLVTATPPVPTATDIAEANGVNEKGHKYGEVEGHQGGWFYCQACNLSLPSAVALRLHIMADYHKSSSSENRS